MDEILRFIRLCKLLRLNIEIAQINRTSPPVQLPQSIHEFLAAAMRKSMTEISWYWYILKDAVWSAEEASAMEEDVSAFLDHGLSRSLGYCDLFPPTWVCLRRNCNNYRESEEVRTLTEPVTYRATLFTMRDGALPIHTTSLYCHSCKIRYHHNYMVDKAGSLRTYYEGPPPAIIQVSTHFFIESQVLELFGNGMVFGWLSANNCARLYNTSLAQRDTCAHNNPLAYGPQRRPPRSRLAKEDWPYSLEMHPDMAMNGFFIYSLLLDKAEQRSHLYLPHDCPTQKDRLGSALAERNKAMEGIGQEEWPHACDLCFIVRPAEAGDGYGELRSIGLANYTRTGLSEHSSVKIQYAVGDGLAMGRPCCAIQDCKINLSTKRDVYCPAHSHYAEKCAILTCDSKAASGFQTCEDPAHRALETAYKKDTSRAIHRLRERLRANGVSVPSEGLSSNLDPFDADNVQDDEVVIVARSSTFTGPTSGSESSPGAYPEPEIEVLPVDVLPNDDVAGALSCEGKPSSADSSSMGPSYSVSTRSGVAGGEELLHDDLEKRLALELALVLSELDVELLAHREHRVLLGVLDGGEDAEDGVEDEHVEGALEGLALGVDVLCRPLLRRGVEEVVAPELGHHLVFVNAELLGVPVGELTESKGPPVKAGTEGDGAFFGVDLDVTESLVVRRTGRGPPCRPGAREVHGRPC
ncbi:hypothetical protein NUW54_g11507 [Trametes sanguinea]|uniref:Uncharacterized protein n=1 Tax=Trametes sanguinea TaxID=158606 RepID=A0ACC1ND92_9APHY|nr:hypothetical protein NUW54_g11507 [Trametes sanguinea]